MFRASRAPHLTKPDEWNVILVRFSTFLFSRGRQGKVRDLYELEDKVVSVTTDRQSGFDRHLASVPFKGQVVNETSVWWLNQTRELVPNALMSAPHPNVAIMKKCRVFPVEFVVRGYLTGSTGTSIWTNYSKGVRSYCGNDLPDGLVKNDKLERNICTPTTKAESGDVPITPQEIIKQGLMTEEDWNYVSLYLRMALQSVPFSPHLPWFLLRYLR